MQTARILVFRVGQLGDMVMSLPALWAVRQHWPEAKFTLLCDVHPGRNYVLGSDILGPTGLFDSIEYYIVPTNTQWRIQRIINQLRLLVRLRRQQYDTLIYLAPSIRKPEQIGRDIRFFRAVGIKKVYGAKHFPAVPLKEPGKPMAAGLSEADLLVARLEADGIPVPAVGSGKLDLVLGEAEVQEVERWLSSEKSYGNRRWIGIGPGSKMQAKRWPQERFSAVVAGLIYRHDVWPVVFGGPEDKACGDNLVAGWGRGFNAAGKLSLRGSSMALKRCAIYLGNDTGTMHLAAAAGTPCVAIFSARDWPGAWFPYGVPQRVFRTAPECEGCYLENCIERANACLNAIDVNEVLAGCEELLKDDCEGLRARTRTPNGCVGAPT